MASAGEAVADELYFSAYSTAKARLVRIGSADEKLKLAALHETLLIDAARQGRYQFALTGIARARPALNACLDQLRTMYDVTEADLAPIATEPQWDVRKTFATSDYPVEALNKNQSGTVGVLLWVEANGRASKCEVIEPIAAPILEQKTCSVLQTRGRFTPAKNLAGDPIRAPTTARIKWQLAN